MREKVRKKQAQDGQGRPGMAWREGVNKNNQCREVWLGPALSDTRVAYNTSTARSARSALPVTRPETLIDPYSQQENTTSTTNIE